MSGSDRDLVAALRSELAAIDPSRPCDRAAEIAGLGAELATREPSIARLAVRLGGRSIEVSPAPTAGHAARARRRFALDVEPFEWDAAPEHCRLAWLRGRFLARGSLSLGSGRAHLEFVVAAADAPVLARRLAAVDLPAGWRVRRGHGVATWKSADAITLFLGRIGAGASLLELQARTVARTLRGELNRVLNAESANLQRSVAAAGRQLAAISLLEQDGRLADQPRLVREIAVARRETPEASLSDMAARLELHRSAVQRALDRIERLALHDDEGVGLRHRDGPVGAAMGESGGRRDRGRSGGRRGPGGRSDAHRPVP